MADRYANDAFANFSSYEGDVFKSSQDVGATDNPDFLYPPKTLTLAEVNKSVPVQRGYMRMLSQGFQGGSTLAKKRLHFQFNPETIVRSVQARNDVQLWMNQDPVQLMQPIPGDANFSFDLLFNREPEVVSSAYRNGSSIVRVNKVDNLATSTTGDIAQSAVTDIGVLADLMVFDEIIGQGINSDLIKKVIDNAQGVAAKNMNDYMKTHASVNAPTTATATVTAVDGSGGITTILIGGGGAGYVVQPIINIVSSAGKNAAITWTILNNKITGYTINTKGTGYKVGDTIMFTGGGGFTSNSANATSDAQDQPPTMFDRGKAISGLTTNFGNSAFLVSLPVRIVFSSLFMVEGYITATTVTFNKFNPHMVPTQCAVNVTMQALYIGFARKDTFLTSSLTQALTDSQNALKNQGAAISSEDAALMSLGTQLFKKIDGGISSDYYRLEPAQIYGSDKKDRKQSVGVEMFPTEELYSLAKRGSISKITMNSNWTFTYQGNSSTAQGNIPVGTPFLTDPDSYEIPIKEFTSLSEKDVKYASVGYSHEKQWVFKDLDASQQLDMSSTSKWLVEYTINFHLEGTAGGKADATQYYSFSTVCNFNGYNTTGKFVASIENGSLKSNYTAPKSAAGL